MSVKTPDRQGQIDLTILMPCLNEAETIGTCIRKALESINRNSWSAEVLVADNGSTDGSIEIAKSLGARVVHVPTRGYGAALDHGIANGSGRWVIMGDSDDSYDFSKLEPFVEKLKEGYDIVAGNRFRGGIEPGAMPLLHRYFGNPALSFTGRLFFTRDVGDFYCGLRGFNRERIIALRLKSRGMEFAHEMIVRASLANYKITEVPTTLKPDGRSRPPHLRTWRDGWSTIKFLLMYCPRWLFAYPGIILIGLGIIIATWLFRGASPFIGAVILDFNTFIAACFMVILGVQLLSFGVLSRVYAASAGFLPADTPGYKLTEKFTVDLGALAALILFIIGLLVFGSAFLNWASLGFSSLNDPIVPRLVMTGLTFMVVALQVFFASFFLGVLRIPVDRSVTQLATSG